MQRFLLSFLFVFSAFGQKVPLLEATKSVVPVIVEINGGFVHGTGIQVRPEAVVISELLLISRTLPQQSVFAGNRQVRGMTSIGNGMILLTVPTLGRDAPLLKVGRISPGPGEMISTFFIGYDARRELSVQNVSIGLDAQGQVRLGISHDVLMGLGLGLGWGLFTADGSLLSVVRSFVSVPNHENGIWFNLELKPADQIISAVTTLTTIATEKF